jgi:hypothetical protein
MGRLPRPRAGRRISGQDHAARPRTKIELQRPDKNAANGDCVGRLVACDPFPDLVTSAVDTAWICDSQTATAHIG